MSKKAEKTSLKETFGTRASKAGGFSMAAAAILIAVVIIINVIASSLPEKYKTFDLSAAGTFTLSETTTKLLGTLGEDITIYHICQSGNEDSFITNTLENYAGASDKITVKNIDPVVNPNFASKYTDSELSDNSVIVTGSKRSKVINYQDMYETSIDYSTYSYTATGFCAENALTNALSFVTDPEVPTLTLLTGHGEKSPCESVLSAVSVANYDTDSLNLLTAGKVGEETDILAIVAPQSDLIENDVTVIKDFIKKGGKLIAFADNLTKEKFPNLISLLSYYGIEMVDGIVFELDSDHYLSSNGQNAYTCSIPNIETHAITDGAANYFAVLPLPQGFHPAAQLRDTLTVEPLLTTSAKAYSATDLDSKETPEKGDGDIDSEGGFNLGAAITDTETEGDAVGKIVFFSSSVLPTEEIPGTFNTTLVINSLNWLYGNSTSVNIPTKSLEPETLTMSASNANLLRVLFVFVIPFMFILIGIIIKVKRKGSK